MNSIKAMMLLGLVAVAFITAPMPAHAAKRKQAAEADDDMDVPSFVREVIEKHPVVIFR